MQAKEQIKLEDVKRIGKACLRLLELDGAIASVAQVHSHIQSGLPRRLSKKLVYSVMKEELGFIFKRVKPIRVRTNSVSCLYQR